MSIQNDNLLVSDEDDKGLIGDASFVQQAKDVAQPPIDVVDGVQVAIHVGMTRSSIPLAEEAIRNIPGMMGRAREVRKKQPGTVLCGVEDCIAKDRLCVCIRIPWDRINIAEES